MDDSGTWRPAQFVACLRCVATFKLFESVSSAFSLDERVEELGLVLPTSPAPIA